MGSTHILSPVLYPPKGYLPPPHSSLHTTAAARWEERVLLLFLKPLRCVVTE